MKDARRIEGYHPSWKVPAIISVIVSVVPVALFVMCIAAPAQVVEINREENWLYADFGGARQQAKLDLLPEVEIGDYVLIHAGFAIEKLSEEAAKESLEAWEELLDILEKEDEEMEKARMADLENQ